MVLSYLGCDSGRYPFFFAFCAFIVFTRGLPALVCLTGAVEVGGSPGSGNPRIKGTEEEKSYRGLLIINVMIILFWLLFFRPEIAPGDVLNINLILLLFLDIIGLIFSFLEACSAFLVFFLIAKA